MVQQHVCLQPELCNIGLLSCLWLLLSLVRPPLQHGSMTFFQVELFLQLVDVLVGSCLLLAQAAFEGLSSFEVFDFSGQWFCEIGNIGKLLSLSETLRQVAINHLSLDVLHSQDALHHLGRQDPRAFMDDTNLFCAYSVV